MVKKEDVAEIVSEHLLKLRAVYFFCTHKLVDYSAELINLLISSFSSLSSSEIGLPM